MTQNKVLGYFIFLNFVPKILFLVQLWSSFNQILFKMKLNTKGYSRLPILKLTIIFLICFSEIPFLGRFGPESSHCFVLNQNMYKEVLRGADSNNFLD